MKRLAVGPMSLIAKTKTPHATLALLPALTTSNFFIPACYKRHWMHMKLYCWLAFCFCFTVFWLHSQGRRLQRPADYICLPKTKCGTWPCCCILSRWDDEYYKPLYSRNRWGADWGPGRLFHSLCLIVLLSEKTLLDDFLDDQMVKARLQLRTSE